VDVRADRLPAIASPYGPLGALALQVHRLTIGGHHGEAILAADEAEHTATAFGDLATARASRLGRMYALGALGRLDEALSIGEALASAPAPVAGPRSTDAKIVADTAEVLIRLGRIDEGLHYLARATTLLQAAPRNLRYVTALSSVCETAKIAELFELADECMRVVVEAFSGGDDLYHASAVMQRAELLLEWGIRLEHVGLAEDAAALYGKSLALLRQEVLGSADTPLGAALLALGCAKNHLHDDARALITDYLVPLRAAGQLHEARLLHLAYGLLLRDTGDLPGARREFLAADELATLPSQHLVMQYELAVTMVLQFPGEATRMMLEALRTHARMLWRVRTERRTMLRQAHRRVELEEARRHADTAASSDALTGLGNRRMFDEWMTRRHGGGTLLLIDVDRFKAINDTFSHGVGDQVLREIAGVLRAHCRHGEVAVRFGGDEFALFLSVGPADAAHIAQRIRQVVRTHDWSIVAAGLTVTLSIGLAPFVEGMRGQELYDRADHNLYRAKSAGRDRVAVA
jgi:diguanylate cyclase (GGDEF)-like protein